MSKIVFISFGSRMRFSKAIQRIRNQAESFQIFDEIHVMDEYDLPREFWIRHQGFVERHYFRGFGYWIWKSFITLQQMNNMNEGDILFYCDVGCVLNIQGLPRFQQYIEIVKNSDSGILSFRLSNLLEQSWCKMDLIDHMNCYHLMDHVQLQATVFFIKKTDKNLDLVKLWYEISCNYHYIDDSPSIIPNHETFLEHRHDQSIFSLLRNNSGTETLETDQENIQCTENPIWILRKDD